MRKYRFDYYLFGLVAILLTIGIVVLTSVSTIFSQENFGNTTHYLFHQIIYGLIPGIVLGFIAFKVKLTTIKKWALLIVLLNLILMVLVFIPGLGITAGGASRWLNLGITSFQPSEFIKLAFIFYLAAWLTSPKRRIRQSSKEKSIEFISFLVIIGVLIFLLTLQSDISTLVVIITVAAVMYFSSNTSFWHSVLLALISIGSFFLLIKIAPYRMKRVQVLLGLIKDPMGLGYQIKQILIAIGSGGLFGLGLGMSSQKFGFIPQTISDSIFAIIAEETGFIGSVILILLFLILFWRGFRISKKTENGFSKLLAIGISSWICIQVFVNIGAMVGILPLTGIPLPFISYGGSHIVAELIGIGILLNISKSKPS